MASSKHAEENFLRMGTGRGAVAAPNLAGYYGRPEGLLGPPVGGLQARAVEKREQQVPIAVQMLGEAFIGRARAIRLQKAVHPGFQPTARHREPMRTDLVLLPAIPQIKGLL